MKSNALIPLAVGLLLARVVYGDDDTLRDLGTNAAPGDIPKYDGSQWRLAHDDTLQVNVGPGLTNSGSLTSMNVSVTFGQTGTTNTNAAARYVEMDMTRPPLGSVVAWMKNFPGTPTNLPTGWVECNGQVLADASSVYNSKTIPNLNGQAGQPQRFLRGASLSGATGGGAHNHMWLARNSGPANGGVGAYSSSVAYDTTWDSTGNPQQYWPFLPGSAKYTDSVDAPPSYYEVVWIMRVR